ncbi:MAG: precorrin-6y C5,15-methyltransferase (decarboxylating) subunit CbiE, partial [Actinomycetes bacterium]
MSRHSVSRDGRARPGPRVTVVGCDGAPLRDEAAWALAEACLVVGGQRHLSRVAIPEGARTLVMGAVREALDAVCRAEEPVVVLASGDPGFFGIVRALRARGLTPDVVPAVSSVSAVFARVGLPWDDALVVSAHGRALAPAVNACRAHPKVAVLTAPGTGPDALGRALRGVPRTLVVAEDLGADGESVTRCTPDEAAGRPWRDPSVVLVLDESRAVGE